MWIVQFFNSKQGEDTDWKVISYMFSIISILDKKSGFLGFLLEKQTV